MNTPYNKINHKPYVETEPDMILLQGYLLKQTKQNWLSKLLKLFNKA